MLNFKFETILLSAQLISMRDSTVVFFLLVQSPKKIERPVLIIHIININKTLQAVYNSEHANMLDYVRL